MTTNIALKNRLWNSAYMPKRKTISSEQRVPTVISMVAGGVGVMLLPTLAVRSEVPMNNLRVRCFADAEPVRTIGLVGARTLSSHRPYGS